MTAPPGLLALVPRIDARLDALLPLPEPPLVDLHSAMRYACLAPGKRMRPALCLLAAQAVGGAVEAALDPACAVEMVHAFSLIHDDLPALDDDALRRGRPTVHVRFGEATAVLAGDALFARAFQTLAFAPGAAEPRVDAVRRLSLASGSGGLVGGEAVDLQSEGSAPEAGAVAFIHAAKTGALIACACALGASFGGAEGATIDRFESFGAELGLAFQIVDDVLNETASPAELGKATGSDRDRRKTTYPACFGLDEARRIAASTIDSAIARLDGLGPAAEPLRELARFAGSRRS